jgi:hypothetical protein
MEPNALTHTSRPCPSVKAAARPVSNDYLSDSAGFGARLRSLRCLRQRFSKVYARLVTFRSSTEDHRQGGSDQTMLFSWYSGDYCTDAAFAEPEPEPELKANPSIASWPEGASLS